MEVELFRPNVLTLRVRAVGRVQKHYSLHLPGANKGYRY